MLHNSIIVSGHNQDRQATGTQSPHLVSGASGGAGPLAARRSSHLAATSALHTDARRSCRAHAASVDTPTQASCWRESLNRGFAMQCINWCLCLSGQWTSEVVAALYAFTSVTQDRRCHC